MPFSKEEAISWAKAAGYDPTHGNAADSEWSLDIRTSNGINLTVWQPTAFPARLVVGAGVGFDQAERQRLSKVAKELDWELKRGLLLMGIGFNVIAPEPGAVPSQVSVAVTIYDDAAGRSQLLNAIQQVVNALVYILLVATRFRDA